MKPIKLTMQNFGPFLNETIDFSKLNDFSLFLINGRTGSGKTMIFDAMTYALYDAGSSSSRDINEMRSHFADEDTPTVVVFEFSIGTKRYKARRQMKYTPSRRKTPVDSEFELYEYINEMKKIIAKKPSEGRTKIKEIMKMDVNQFRQILILPQGEFKRFLVANTREKSIVLSQLFETFRFKEIEDRLKTKRDALEKETELEEKIIIDSINRFKSDAIIEKPLQLLITERKEEVEQLSKQLESNKILLDTLKQELVIQESQLNNARKTNEYFSELDNINTSLKQMNERKEIHQSQIAQLERLKKISDIQDYYQLFLDEKNQLKVDHQQLEKLEVLKIRLKNELKEAIESRALLMNDEDKINKYKTFIRDFYHYFHDNSMNTIEYDLEEKNKEIKQLEQQLVTFNQAGDIDNILSLLESLQEEKHMNVKHSAIIQQQLAESLTKLNDIKENNKKAEKKKELLELQQKEQQSLQNISENDEIKDEVIAVYRNELQVGCACPVCLQNVEQLPPLVDIEAYNNRKKQRTEIEKRLSKYNHQLEELADIELIEETSYIEKHTNLSDELDRSEQQETLLNNQINELKEKRDELNKQLNTLKTLSEQLQNEKVKYESLFSKWDEFKQQTGYHNFLSFRDDYELKKEQVESFDDKIKQLERKNREAETKAIANQTELESKSVQLKERSQKVEDIKKILDERLSVHHIDEKELQQEVNSGDIKQLENEVEEYKNKYALLTSQQNRLEALTKNSERMNLIELETVYEEKKSIVEAKQNEYIVDNENYNFNKQLVDEVSNRYTSFEQQHKQFTDYNHLYRLLGGKGANKLTLENFVLRYYLEQTLMLSNIRLLQMTSHRYELRLRDEKKGTGFAGLDIEIYDYYSNDVRDISTLSGGETFLASLSLALGLSDYAAQRFGGIIIESLFIDEGFGTLDQETLDIAISALVELEMAGKMVGLISHVDSLKDRIPAHLVVSSSGYTSKVAFELK